MKRILIIDDEEGVTQLVKLNLEASGKYEVRTENRGSLGLIAAKQFKPDLILLDLIMPDMGGGEVSGQLKSDEGTKIFPLQEVHPPAKILFSQRKIISLKIRFFFRRNKKSLGRNFIQ